MFCWQHGQKTRYNQIDGLKKPELLLQSLLLIQLADFFLTDLVSRFNFTSQVSRHNDSETHSHSKYYYKWLESGVPRSCVPLVTYWFILTKQNPSSTSIICQLFAIIPTSAHGHLKTRIWGKHVKLSSLNGSQLNVKSDSERMTVKIFSAVTAGLFISRFFYLLIY